MSSNTTRGRSYTSFPRNTKQAYIRTCAKEAREAEKRAVEVEQAYSEYTPTQIKLADEMEDALFDKRERDLLFDLGIDLTNYVPSDEHPQFIAVDEHRFVAVSR